MLRLGVVFLAVYCGHSITSVRLHMHIHVAILLWGGALKYSIATSVFPGHLVETEIIVYCKHAFNPMPIHVWSYCLCTVTLGSIMLSTYM